MIEIFQIILPYSIEIFSILFIASSIMTLWFLRSKGPRFWRFVDLIWVLTAFSSIVAALSGGILASLNSNGDYFYWKIAPNASYVARFADLFLSENCGVDFDYGEIRNIPNPVIRSYCSDLKKAKSQSIAIGAYWWSRDGVIPNEGGIPKYDLNGDFFKGDHYISASADLIRLIKSFNLVLWIMQEHNSGVDYWNDSENVDRIILIEFLRKLAYALALAVLPLRLGKSIFDIRLLNNNSST